MRVLIVYGSTEGHTRALSHFAARALSEAGIPTAVAPAAERDQPVPAPYDAVILAASVHTGAYQAPLVAYAREHHEVLNEKPSAFISVSLSSVGFIPEGWQGCDDCLARFQQQSLWTPRSVHQAAGAIRYSQYDFFKRLALKFIAAERGHQVATSHDYDLTDYDALNHFVTGFAGEVAR